ncbi:nuclear transport factor 2 family protein [Pseudophaeobacter sp.]|uniref:nuclear transport factor 2 family protein n=1 Tax=Pseudophaeobacter sp. TaxID=1971739 RepID=UPI00405939A5
MALTTEDKIEIQDLMGRFALAVDVNGPEAMRDLFVDDAQFIVEEMGIHLEGLDTIVEWITENAAAFPPGLIHVQSNFVIDVNGDTAELRCISQAIQNHDGEIKHFVVGRYFETLVKTAQGWRLKTHKLQVQA